MIVTAAGRDARRPAHPAPRVPEAKLRQLYCKMTLAAIGTRYGVTRERVRQWMERAGIARRPTGGVHKIPCERWPEICRDYARRPRWGALMETAREWGVRDSTILRILVASGVWIPGQARKIPIGSWFRVRGDYSRLGSMVKVAGIWGVSSSTIRNILIGMDAEKPKGWSRKHKEG